MHTFFVIFRDYRFDYRKVLTLFLYLKQVLTFLNDVFDTLLKALSDPSDEVIFLPAASCPVECLIISSSCISIFILFRSSFFLS